MQSQLWIALPTSQKLKVLGNIETWEQRYSAYIHCQVASWVRLYPLSQLCLDSNSTSLFPSSTDQAGFEVQEAMHIFDDISSAVIFMDQLVRQGSTIKDMKLPLCPIEYTTAWTWDVGGMISWIWLYLIERYSSVDLQRMHNTKYIVTIHPFIQPGQWNWPNFRLLTTPKYN